ncbi:hypothetical protein ACQY0O_003817 [Thecaphora frezii]
MLASSVFQAQLQPTGSTSGHGEPAAAGNNLARNGSVARSDAIAKLRRAASQRELRSRPPNGHRRDSPEDNRPRPTPISPDELPDAAAALHAQQQQHEAEMNFTQHLPQLHGRAYPAALDIGAADVASSSYGDQPIAMANAAVQAPQLDHRHLSPSLPFASPGLLSPAAASPIGRSYAWTPDMDHQNEAPALARSLSPMAGLRERAVARSPLPSLEQLRARILHEREAAGLQRSASTSAASQAARAYALEKLLGTSSTERFYDHSREGTLIERDAATPSPTMAQQPEGSSDEDDGVESDRPYARPPHPKRASLRRSRTIGGLSAMAERQRKAAFVEGVFLAVPGTKSNRLSRIPQHLAPGSGGPDPADQQKQSKGDGSGANAGSVPTASDGTSISRSLSQRQIARTEMMRKLSSRGRKRAAGQANPSQQPSALPSSSNSPLFAPDASVAAAGSNSIPLPPAATAVLTRAAFPYSQVPLLDSADGADVNALGRTLPSALSAAASFGDGQVHHPSPSVGAWENQYCGDAESALRHSAEDQPPDSDSAHPGAPPVLQKRAPTDASPTAKFSSDNDVSEEEDDFESNSGDREGFYGLYGSQDDNTEADNLGEDFVGRTMQPRYGSGIGLRSPTGEGTDEEDQEHLTSPAPGAFDELSEPFDRTGDDYRTPDTWRDGEFRTQGFGEATAPSTPANRLSIRPSASVPYDSSPYSELDVGDLRKSSFIAMSPSGVNVPLQFFDHRPDSRSDAVAQACPPHEQVHGDWPLSVDSSGTVPSGRDSVDALRPNAGLGGSSTPRPADEQGVGDFGHDRNAGDDAGEGNLMANETVVWKPSDASGLREPDTLAMPSLQSKPSERLNAILGSSFVQEFAKDLDFDSHSKSSLYDAASVDERVPVASALGLHGAINVDPDEADSESGSSLSGREAGSSGSEANGNALDEELDERRLRKLDHMAEKLGRLGQTDRAQRSAGQPERPGFMQEVQGQAGRFEGNRRLVVETALPAKAQLAAEATTIESTLGGGQGPKRADAVVGGAAADDAPPELLSDDASASAGPRQTGESSLPVRQLQPVVPRRTHSHQTSIDSLISALDAGGALNSPPSLARSVSARTAVRVPMTLHTATSVPAPRRLGPNSPGLGATNLLSNDKLAPFPGLVQRASTAKAADHRGPPSPMPTAVAAAAPRQEGKIPPGSGQHHHNGSPTPRPAPAPEFAPELPSVVGSSARAEKSPGPKQGNFLTTLRRKASGAFVGSHSRSGSRDGFWSRKGSIKRVNSAAKVGGSDRHGHALKIEHPHHTGGPVRIITPRRPATSGGSPSSAWTADSPEVQQRQDSFSANNSRFHEQLDDGRAEQTGSLSAASPAAAAATAAASASASLAPATAAMVHRYSRMLTAQVTPTSVPGISTVAGQNPPRKLLMDGPVFQVISATTVKDRYLFLLSDILVIAKPVAQPDSGVGGKDDSAITTWTNMKTASVLPDSRWTFSVKNILDLGRVKLSITADSRSPPAKSRADNPTLLAFVDHFGRDPDEAVRTLVTRARLQDTTASIAQLLYQTPELDRAVLTDYLTAPTRRDLLAAYIAQHRMTGVSIESGLRSLLLELRFPKDVESFEAVLIHFARRWVACNASLVKPDFTPELASDLVFAIMALNDALHSESPSGSLPQQTLHTFNVATPSFFSEACPTLSKDDFLRVFRKHDASGVLSDRTLGRIYLSVRSEPIAQALTSQEPRFTVRLKGGKLPTRLTYGQASEPVTLYIPAADPDLAIRLYAQDTTFEPSVLTFGKSREASFTMTSKSLGYKQIIFVRAGRNARYYSGTELDDRRSGQARTADVQDSPLSRSFTVLVERAFMKHSFTVASQDADGTSQSFMLSFEGEAKMQAWLDALQRAALQTLQAREAYGLSISDALRLNKQQHQEEQHVDDVRARRAADAIALQVLRETLIASDEAAAPTEGAPGLSRSATVNGPAMPVPRGLQPPSSSSPLDRQASTSRHYYAGGGVGQHERELLIPSSHGATAAVASTLRGGLGGAPSSTAAGRSVGGGHTKGAASLSIAPLATEDSDKDAAMTAQRLATSGTTRPKVDGAGASKTLKGDAIVTICRQNSLLPLVLAHLETSSGSYS